MNLTCFSLEYTLMVLEVTCSSMLGRSWDARHELESLALAIKVLKLSYIKYPKK